ncbi:GSPII_E, type II/IV secretion system protein [Corynebacterium kutscheri]|uniref:GSPII_E, type II/IV secretion system protein n=1 Tax=Corynebacterium kutscheri TaxID=35755 RepID=A0AB38VR01_9CORY|nr:TadA family conjugal transfer-associated ATPase [Corynebacterium kutscheri]VEH05233.1 GSPII_E, type II/IV secretion system protein [Corynebacterium kutscheri]VEH80703.1 GSPII_E, type II/IV secretion system protein [Corynebacterium kutscheri]
MQHKHPATVKYDEVAEEVHRRISSREQVTDRATVQLIREVAGVISDQDVLSVLRKIRHDSQGVGVLESVLALPGVTDIVVNGTHGTWFDRGNGLEKASIRFEKDQDVRRLATRLLVASGRRLDDAQSFADGRLYRDDGSSIRIHAILSPPSENGTCLSLRVLRQKSVSLKQLYQGGSFDDEMYAELQKLIRRRRNFLVVGGTGSGKTTLLGALLREVDHHERIICIEDTAELRPKHPHFLTLVTRSNNIEGKGEITMADLLKQSLRMRPDRIVVGEIRGVEVVDLLAALNTGHDGCAGTVHANSIEEVPARLEALAALGGLDTHALHSQLCAAAPMVLVMKKTASGRRLSQIGELRGNPIRVHILYSAEVDS